MLKEDLKNQFFIQMFQVFTDNDPSYVMDVNGKFLLANNAAAKLFNFNLGQQLRGKVASKIFSANSWRKMSEIFEEIKKSRNSVIKEFQYGKDWFSHRVVPLFDNNQSIHGFLITARNVTDLRNQAYKDQLTGLYNRWFFDDLLSTEIKRSIRFKHAISFLMIDVNDFKQINDVLGHEAGDKVLRSVAEIIGHSIRNTDYVIRWGGDEFLIVCPESQDPDSVKKRILDNLDKINRRRGKFPITLSIGCSIWQPKDKDDEETVKKIIALADQAMYKEKKSK